MVMNLPNRRVESRLRCKREREASIPLVYDTPANEKFRSSPTNELRRDSGYDNENVDDELQKYDFGKQDILF